MILRPNPDNTAIMKHCPKWVIPILALTFLAGCDSCRDEAPRGALSYVARDAPVVLTVPELGELSRGLDGFVGQLTRKVGKDVVRKLRTGLTAQIGIDPLKATAWKHAGVNADKPLSIFLEPSTLVPLCVLEVSDPGRFDKAIRGLMVRMDGANKVVTEQVAGHEVMTIGRPFGADVVPSLHKVRLGNVVLLALGDGREGLIQGLKRAINPDSGSIEVDPVYQKLTQRSGPGLARVFLRGASAEPLVGQELAALSEGASLSLAAAPTGLELKGFVATGLEGVASLASLPSAASLAENIEQGAAVFGLTQLVRPEGLTLLEKTPALAPLLGRMDRAMKKETGLDLRTDALGLLAGPATVSVYLTNIKELLSELRKPDASVRRLVSRLGVAVTAELRDPAKLEALLEKSRAALSKTRAPVRVREVSIGEHTMKIFEPDRADTTLGWGVAGQHYVYAVGAGRAERTARYLLRDAAAKKSMAAALKESPAFDLAQRRGASVLVIRTTELAAAFDDVADMVTGQAKRVGAGQVVNSVIDLVKTLGDIAFSVEPAAGGLEFTVRERLQ